MVALGKECINENLDILLIRPNYPQDFWPVLPWGCLDLANYLEKHGFKTGVWDPPLDSEATDWSLSETIEKGKPQFVGISTLSSQLKESRRLARIIAFESPKTKIIAGGQHCTVDPNTFPEADIVVQGEGELALLKILKEKGSKERVLKGEGLSDLDQIPITNKSIYKHYDRKNILDQMGLNTARGCPYNCGFCLGKNQRRNVPIKNSPKRVLEMIKTAKEGTNAKRVFFLDDIFTLPQNWVTEVCDAITAESFKSLDFACFSHVLTSNPKTYEKMGRAGFRQIQIGLESGDEKQLKRMGKTFSIQQAKEAINWIRNSGIEPNALFILGYPGETLASMQKTLEFAHSLECTLWFSLAQPFPGSKFFEEAMKTGILLEKDFSKYSNTSIVYLPEKISENQMLLVWEISQKLKTEHEKFKKAYIRNGISLA